ncbi:MAG: peptidoglycan-binding domain-containing protein [Hyphomicrobiales bacterium]
MTFSNPSIPLSQTLLKRGDRGVAVEHLQAKLNREDLCIATDGNFGPATELAVKIYQKGQRLHGDGVVGARTWAQFADSG